MDRPFITIPPRHLGSAARFKREQLQLPQNKIRDDTYRLTNRLYKYFADSKLQRAKISPPFLELPPAIILSQNMNARGRKIAPIGATCLSILTENSSIAR